LRAAVALQRLLALGHECPVFFRPFGIVGTLSDPALNFRLFLIRWAMKVLRKAGRIANVLPADWAEADDPHRSPLEASCQREPTAGRPTGLAPSYLDFASAAEIVRRYDPDFAEFRRRLNEAGKPKVTRVAIAHKLLTRLSAKARDVREKLAQTA
jgi:hypothetical protein